MFGSTALVYNALNSSNVALPNVLVYVPQKGYAVITPETPENIKGLYTTGLSVCSG